MYRYPQPFTEQLQLVANISGNRRVVVPAALFQEFPAVTDELEFDGQGWRLLAAQQISAGQVHMITIGPIKTEAGSRDQASKPRSAGQSFEAAFTRNLGFCQQALALSFEDREAGAPQWIKVRLPSRSEIIKIAHISARPGQIPGDQQRQAQHAHRPHKPGRKRPQQNQGKGSSPAPREA